MPNPNADVNTDETKRVDCSGKNYLGEVFVHSEVIDSIRDIEDSQTGAILMGQVLDQQVKLGKIWSIEVLSRKNMSDSDSYHFIHSELPIVGVFYPDEQVKNSDPLFPEDDLPSPYIHLFFHDDSINANLVKRPQYQPVGSIETWEVSKNPKTVSK